MKNRSVLPVLAMLLLTGCGGKMHPAVDEPTENHTNPPWRTTAPAETTGSTATTSTTAADPAVQRRIDAVGTAEPVPIPENGWTDETLLPVISVCGKVPKETVRLSDLFYGYEILTDDREYLEKYADSIFTGTLLLYHQSLVLENAFADDLPDVNIPMFIALGQRWNVVLEDGSNRAPITVNCVGIGAGSDMLREYISAEELPGRGHFDLQIETEHFRVLFSGEDGLVDRITLNDYRRSVGRESNNP